MEIKLFGDVATSTWRLSGIILLFFSLWSHIIFGFINIFVQQRLNLRSYIHYLERHTNIWNVVLGLVVRSTLLLFEDREVLRTDFGVFRSCGFFVSFSFLLLCDEGMRLAVPSCFGWSTSGQTLRICIFLGTLHLSRDR